jgi:hypothetical protein
MNRIEIKQQSVRIDESLNLLWDAYELFNDSKSEIGNSNKTWKVLEDLRLLIFDNFRSTVHNSLYSLFFVKENLSRIGWWRTTKSMNLELTKKMTEDDVKNAVAVYLTDIKINLIFNTFKNLEVFMRDLCRNIINTNKCNLKFSKVRDEIIEFTGLNHEFNDFITLFQHIRNTQHNNGFYFAEKDVTIIYKGVSYKFENGRPITFLDFDFLRLLLIDTNSLLLAIIESERISEIDEIISLYSKIDFTEY